jgi:hypothetical protein
MSEGGIDAIGYIAMVFVALSIAMKDVKKLRVLNLTGAICFIVYGFFIESNPVLILNAILASLNGYHIMKLKKE